jgi:hypothetical protein
MGDIIGVGDVTAVTLTVAIVAGLRNWLSLPQQLTALVAFIVAIVMTIIVNLGMGIPIVWGKIPLEAIQAWLGAMGVWSGGKALLGK